MKIADPAADRWTPSKEARERVEEWGALDQGSEAELRTTWIEAQIVEVLRTISMEAAEADGKVSLKESAKRRIARFGWEKAEEGDQTGKAGVPWYEKPELVEVLTEIGRTMEDAWLVGRRKKEDLSVRHLERWHGDLMAGKSQAKRSAVPIVSIACFHPYRKKGVKCVRMPPTSEAREIVNGLPARVKEWIDDPKIPTAMVAAKAHMELWHAHPWGDGNTRSSRALVVCVYAARGEMPPIMRGEEKHHTVHMDALFAGFIAEGSPGTCTLLAEHLQREQMETMRLIEKRQTDLSSGASRRRKSGAISHREIAMEAVRQYKAEKLNEEENEDEGSTGRGGRGQER